MPLDLAPVSPALWRVASNSQLPTSHSCGTASNSCRTTSRVESGAAAEERAAQFLLARGLDIIGRNLRCRAGELDLVCLDSAVLVIVEVRQRGSTRCGGAAASVTASKQNKLLRATLFQWQRRPDWRGRLLRFDVVAIEGTAPDAAISWIKDAFRAT